MEQIVQKLKEAIRKLFDVEVEPEVTEAPEDTGADYASNVAFQLCKELRDSPRNIAEKISHEMNNAEGGDEIRTEVAGGGFINFISPDEYFVKKMDEGEMRPEVYQGKRVVCEFSDPNPFKVLHVGHLYTSVVGDAIARLIENAGGEVIRANFGGDVGLHVSKTIYAIMTAQESDLLRQQVRDSLSVPQSTVRSVAPASLNLIFPEQSLDSLSIEDIAKAYVEGTRAYEEDEKAHEEITALNKRIYEINANDEHGNLVADIYWKGRELSYQYFEEFYKGIGVKFDKYYPESTVARRGLETIKSHPEVYEESDGALVFRGEKYGLHTRVFVNKEGLPTYEAKDVGLLFTKNEDWKFDESIVITGNDIIDYMKVVLKSVEQYAPELVEKTTHITHGNVRLPGNEKMSSRKGNFIKAVDIVNEVREKCGGNEKITLAAIKYGFLRYKIGGNIEFDIDECVSTTGNSGVYLLYSAVRAKKILEKVGEVNENENKNKDVKLDVYERKLCKKMARQGEVISEATEKHEPHLICNFLYEMSQEFSRFYENCPVNGSEKVALRKKIVRTYLEKMEQGLGLLGIEIPEKM